MQIVKVTLLFLAVFTCMGHGRLTLAASASEVVVLESVELDTVVADFPIGYNLMIVDGIHYATYYNRDRFLTVAARDPQTGDWQHKYLPEKVGWDSHNSIAMAVDREGYLHVSGNMHAVPLIYYRSERPRDIQTLTKVFPMVDEQDEKRCTYPRFMKNREGTLFFQYRTGGSGNGREIFNVYDQETRSWESLLGQSLFDGQEKMSTYRSGPGLGADGYYHVSWVWRDTPHCETNHDLSYMRSSNLKDWETITGEPITLPVRPNTPGVIVDPVPTKGGVINGGHRLGFDKQGHPCFAYHKYDNAGISQLYVALWRDESWLIQQVSDWKYRWDFQGAGSIDFDISIRSLRALDDERLAIAFRHKREGNGEYVVDAQTGKRLNDIAPPRASSTLRIPKTLQNAQSSIPNVGARFSRIIRDPLDDNIAYVLRWEMWTKRDRLNRPPNIPVPPSTMLWYKFGVKQP